MIIYTYVKTQFSINAVMLLRVIRKLLLGVSKLTDREQEAWIHSGVINGNLPHKEKSVF